MNNSNKNNIFLRIISNLRAMIHIFTKEFKWILKDRGVLIIIVIAPLAYAILYPYLYTNETLVDVPIAVVDHCNTARSARLTRSLDATMDLKVLEKLDNLEQAKVELYKGNIHGIVYIPSDFDKKIEAKDQASISMYSDMGSFMYYRAMVLAVNYVSLDRGEKIKMKRLNDAGVSGYDAEVAAKPLLNESTILYNPGMGFSSFLLTAVLILILHQTLVFGIGMAAGAERENNLNNELILNTTSRGGVFRVVMGRALSYFIVYLLWSAFVLLVVPKMFNLPHIGDYQTILAFVVPFLLATIFFGMTISYFNMERETQMIMFIFFSLILLFLSGISWPQSNMSGFWRVFSYLFPATFGIQGFIKSNTMGATASAIQFEIAGLWIQTLVYFITTSILYFKEIKQNEQNISIE